MTEQITAYIINVGTFTQGTTTYPDRCLSASYGGSGVPSETIPWADTDYNPWDYRAEYEGTGETKHYTGTFVLDQIVIPTPTPVPTDLEKLEAQALYTAVMTGTLIEEEANDESDDA